MHGTFGSKSKKSTFKALMLENRRKNQELRNKFYDSKQSPVEVINAYKEFDNVIEQMCLSMIDIIDESEKPFHRKLDIYYKAERQLFLAVKELPVEKWNEKEINIYKIVEDVCNHKEEA